MVVLPVLPNSCALKTRSMIRTGGSSSSQTHSSQTISSVPVPHRFTQEQINVISSQVLASIETKVLASVETKLEEFFNGTAKKIKWMVSHAFPDQEGSSSHPASVPDIQDDVGDDDDNSDSDDDSDKSNGDV